MTAEQYIKLTVEDYNHNGLVYHEGLNQDFQPWSTNKECSSGGIYICRKQDLAHWTHYSHKKKMIWVWDAVIPDTATKYEESNRKVKVNQVILSNCRSIHELAQELWNTEAKQMKAVDTCCLNFKFMDNPPESVQLTAIHKNPYLIRHIQNPSKEVKALALQQNPFVARYIQPRVVVE